MDAQTQPLLQRFSRFTLILVEIWICVASAVGSTAQSFTSLHSFCSAANCPDGEVPNGWLVQGNDGNLYGTAVAGGANAHGTVFKISTAGAFITLHSFIDTDGSGPSALIQATDGNFYGTTSSGGGTNCSRGSNACGTVFKISPSGTLTTLYVFCSKPNCTDGYFPAAALVQGRDGNLYGTTQDGGTRGQCGTFGCGTVFKITLTGNLTTLYAFCPQANCPFDAPDGAHPSAALVQGADGSFYGTTTQGGSTDNNCTFGCGTIFKVTSGGSFTSLHTFDGDGINPGQIMQALDGNFYGVTVGTLYKMTPGGALTTIHSFDITDGYAPVGLLQATDGNFYGITSQGGNNSCVFGCGTIFKTNPSGAITTLHEFSGADGDDPTGGLVQSTDGNFYGTTSKGGTSNNCQSGCGTIFKLGVGIGPFVEVQPSSGNVGTHVTILGSNLSGATAVTFNGTSSVFTVLSPSEIATAVPAAATTGVIRVTAPGGTLVSNADFQVPGPFQFVQVSPCRLLDTRKGHGPLQGGTTTNFAIPQLGSCGIPASASVYSLNVTVVPHGPLGYLTIWSAGEVQPYASTMNSPDGRTKANAAIVPAGNNAVSVYVSDTTDLVLDIDGYFENPSSQTEQFFPLTPCRVIDTRKGTGDLAGPFLTGRQERDFPVLESGCIPQNASIQAYSFNVTVQPHPAGQPLSYLRIWPQGETQPTVSTLNNPTATLVANAAIVAAGTDGGIAVLPSDSTDLIVDITGYFAAPGTGGLSLYPVPSCRVLDTRKIGNGDPFAGELTVQVTSSGCAPPAGARAYTFNATVLPEGPLGYLTLWPDGETRPGVSTLNALDGLVTSNMAIVPTTNGSIDAYASSLTQLILDISSYFAP